MNERASSEWQTSHVSVGDWRAPLIVWLRQEECFNSSTSKLVPAAGLVFVRVCVCFILSESVSYSSQMVFLCHPRLYPQCSRGAVRPVCPVKQLRVHSLPLIHSQQLLFCHSQHRDAEKRFQITPFNCPVHKLLFEGTVFCQKHLIISNSCRFWGIWSDYLCFWWFFCILRPRPA